MTGTFSSVYLAHDLELEHFDNSYYLDSFDWVGRPKLALKKVLVTSSPQRIENELAILECVRSVLPVAGQPRTDG